MKYIVENMEHGAMIVDAPTPGAAAFSLLSDDFRHISTGTVTRHDGTVTHWFSIYDEDDRLVDDLMVRVWVYGPEIPQERSDRSGKVLSWT